jgi:hypothetical protein
MALDFATCRATPYKDKVTGKLSIGEVEWGYSWSQHQVSYANLELQIIKQVEENG